MQKYQSHKVVSAAMVDGYTYINGNLELALNGTFSPMIVEGETAERVVKAMEREDDGDLGYFVVYEDNGYVSWSPTEAFEAGYTKNFAMSSREVITEAIIRPGTIMSGGPMMDFGMALHAMRDGKRVAREGWNGKGMHIECQTPDAGSKMTHPYLFMVIPECEEGTRQLPWQPAQVDIFAQDWLIIE